MGKQEILNILKQSKPELASRYGVRRDIDLFEFVDLREYLEAKLDNKVDLVMASALKPAIGKRILAEVEYA